MNNKHFRLAGVQTGKPYTLHLQFKDGLQASVDLQTTIKHYRSLHPLLDAALFARAATGEFGASVIWGDDDKLALAADNLRALAFTQLGHASHQTIIEWMDKHQLTLDDAAIALGISRRMLAYYRSGAKPVRAKSSTVCTNGTAMRASAAGASSAGSSSCSQAGGVASPSLARGRMFIPAPMTQ